MDRESSPDLTNYHIVQAFFRVIEATPNVVELDVRRSINALAPVSRLPVELLAMIFESITDRFWEIHPIPLTHVCHHWRQVAINQKTLWTTIPTFSPSWAKTFIERSSPRPITMQDISPLHPERCAQRYQSMRAILGELSRLTSLRLTEISPQKDEHWTLFLPDAMRLLSQSPAAILTGLEISEKSHLIDPQRPRDVFIDLPDDFLANKVPENLRRLVLTTCRLTPGLAPLKAPLTYIDLSHCCVGSRFDHIVDVLSSLPSLENLSLTKVVSRLPPPVLDAPPHNKVALPNIRSINLCEGIRHATGLMQRFSFPRSAHLLIRCKSDEDIVEMEEVEDLARLIRLIFSPAHASGIPIRNTIISVIPSVWFSVGTHNPPSLAPISANPPMKLNHFKELEMRENDLRPKIFDVKPPVEPMESPLASQLFQEHVFLSVALGRHPDFDSEVLHLLPILPAAMELALFISYDVFVDREDWVQRCEGEWRYLESVTIAGESAAEFIFALNSAYSPSDSTHSQVPFLPFLTAVSLSLLDLKTPSEEDGRTLLDDLMGAMENRKAVFGKLVRLKIENSLIAEDSTHRLWEVVEDIEVVSSIMPEPATDEIENVQQVDV